MKKWSIILLSLAAILGVISVMFYIPTAHDDAVARTNKKRIMTLVKIGDNLVEAEEILRRAGFRLAYESPIKPTINEDYFQQLVVVRGGGPNLFDTVSYVTRCSMPFSHKESPCVAINAALDGIITKIE